MSGNALRLSRCLFTDWDQQKSVKFVRREFRSGLDLKNKTKKKKILTKPQFYSFISRSGRNHRLFIAENGFSHVSLIWRVFSKFNFRPFLSIFIVTLLFDEFFQSLFLTDFCQFLFWNRRNFSIFTIFFSKSSQFDDFFAIYFQLIFVYFAIFPK